jgi:hypothetical protein
LYALLRPDQAVAKGTITGTKTSIKLGGQPIERQYCEVIVTYVLKRDTILPHPYDGMETLADASMMPIAWPYKKVISLTSTFLLTSISYACERAESEKATLEQRECELQDQLEQRASQDHASEEPGSQHGSNMRQNLV